METVQWIFDGIGSQIVGLLLGLLIGGASGYGIAIRKTKTNIKQSQKAGDNANQQQAGVINNYGNK